VPIQKRKLKLAATAILLMLTRLWSSIRTIMMIF